MKPLVLISLVISLSTACSAVPPRAEFEISIGVPSAVDSSLWHATLRVLESRVEKIAEGGSDFIPAGDGKYTLYIATPLTGREVEFVLTSPGRLEFWETCSWSSDLPDLYPWCRELWEEDETEFNRDSKLLATYILSRRFVSDPCSLEGVSSQAYPVVMRVLDSLKHSGLIPGNIRFGRRVCKDDFGADVYTICLLKCDSERNGPFADNSSIEKLTFAAPSRKTLFPELIIDFNAAGAERMREVTAGNIGKQIAISFDGTVLMTPVIHQPIENGKASVSQGSEPVGEGEFFLNCIPAIVGSGTLAMPVACRPR